MAVKPPPVELVRLHPSAEVLQSSNPGQDFLTPNEWLKVSALFGLSSRETGVAVLLVEGRTRDQIGRELKCAPGTVRVYIDRLFKKLNVEDRVGLALRIARVYVALRLSPVVHEAPPVRISATVGTAATCRES